MVPDHDHHAQFGFRHPERRMKYDIQQRTVDTQIMSNVVVDEPELPDAKDNAVFEQTKLTMPVLAVGGEKSFGALQAEIMRHVAINDP
jgi:hypothetical protein